MIEAIDNTYKIELFAAGGKWTKRAAKEAIQPGEVAWRNRACSYVVQCFKAALEKDDFSLIKLHPLAEFFPPMDKADFAALKSSITKEGNIREQISVAEDGRVLDGANRLRALFELVKEGMDFKLTSNHVDAPIQTPHLAQVSNDEFQMNLVLSKNLARRHLTPQQKAMVIAKVTETMPKAESTAKANAVSHGKSCDGSNELSQKTDAERAAEAGIGLATLKRARKTLRDDPELAEATIQGKAAVTELKASREPSKPARSSEPREEIPKEKKLAITHLYDAIEKYGSLWGFDDKGIVDGVNGIIAGYKS